MKKIVFLSLFALCLPWMVSAQSIDDDLYYVPSKNQGDCEKFGGQLNQQSNETCQKQEFEEKVHGEIPKVFAENNYHLKLRQ